MHTYTTNLPTLSTTFVLYLPLVFSETTTKLICLARKEAEVKVTN